MKGIIMKILLVILLLVSLIITGCTSGQVGAAEDAAEPEQEITAEEDLQEEEAEETTEAPDDSGMEDAASVLPESWMAYPGSKIDIDYMARGLTDYPSWQILVPGDATYQDVEEYFLTMADEQPDFEAVDASAGSWQWRGKEVYIEILKEDNLVYSLGFPEGID